MFKKPRKYWKYYYKYYYYAINNFQQPFMFPVALYYLSWCVMFFVSITFKVQLFQVFLSLYSFVTLEKKKSYKLLSYFQLCNWDYMFVCTAQIRTAICRIFFFFSEHTNSKKLIWLLPWGKLWTLVPHQSSVAAMQQRLAGSCRSECRPACARARWPGCHLSCELASFLLPSSSSLWGIWSTQNQSKANTEEI